MEREKQEQKPRGGACWLGFRDSKMASVAETGGSEGKNGREEAGGLEVGSCRGFCLKCDRSPWGA